MLNVINGRKKKDRKLIYIAEDSVLILIQQRQVVKSAKPVWKHQKKNAGYDLLGMCRPTMKNNNNKKFLKIRNKKKKLSGRDHFRCSST